VTVLRQLRNLGRERRSAVQGALGTHRCITRA
jgi:hypothetical protein